jgi:iron complex outermembrane receptor protein
VELGKRHIDDYGNNKGVRDTVQTLYRFNAGQYFYFSRMALHILRRVTLEGAASLNYNWYQYRDFAPILQPSYTDIKFDLQVMPRIALSVQIVNGFSWRASVSRGYSPPTLSELHPSATAISTGLQAESGWNYETGFRFRERHDLIRFDEVVFYYQLQNAIVSRTDSAGNDYFINAGGTRQLGWESQVLLWPVRQQQHGFVRDLQLGVAYTYDHFRFGNYQSGAANYTGRYLTGVPPNVLVCNANMQMPLGFYLFAEYTYTSHLPLDDANDAWAKYYNLVQLRAGWRRPYGHVMIELYAGVNNLLNEKYSLGDDINAAGNRFYNAAMPINYYGGVKVGYAR